MPMWYQGSSLFYISIRKGSIALQGTGFCYLFLGGGWDGRYVNRIFWLVQIEEIVKKRVSVTVMNNRLNNNVKIKKIPLEGSRTINNNKW